MNSRFTSLAGSIVIAIFSLALFIPVAWGTASGAAEAVTGIEEKAIMKSGAGNYLPSYPRPEFSLDKPLSISGLIFLPLVESDSITIDPNIEHAALMALYHSTDGEMWYINKGWGTDTPYCEWYGVTCDENGHVTGLNLQGSQASGTIPPEIGNLPKLTSLRIGSLFHACPDNQVFGPAIYDPIPPEIGNLASLQELDLSCNKIASLPAEIGRLAKLQGLNLGNNRLNSIPPEIGNLTNLQNLVLGNNQLISLPPQIGNLKNVWWFYLSDNKIVSLPPEIGKLVKLQYLYLDVNQLTFLPQEICNLSSLETLSLGSNRLSGPIPAFLSHLNHLSALALYNNPDLTCWETKEAHDWAVSLPSYDGPTCFFP